MRRTLTAVAALALSAGFASAQDLPSLRVGQEVSGSLSDSDARVDDPDAGQFVYDDYVLEARQGQRLDVILRAEAFDAYLELYREGEDEPFASDDDGLGEGTDSRLRVAPGAGRFRLRARTLGGLDGGDYTLAVVDRGPAPRAPRPQTLRIGGTVQGEIGGRDPVDTDGANEYTYDAYAFRGRAGQRVAIRLDSEAFDPIVRIGRMRGSSFEELAVNDDAASGGLNSYLVFTLPSDGEYVVRAAPLSGDRDGDYTLSLSEGPPPAQARSIAVGDTVEGDLTLDANVSDQGQRADLYAIEVSAGQRIVLDAGSEDFDTYLELFSEEDGRRVSLATDDDGAGQGTNSRLAHTFERAGRYLFEVRSFGVDGAGAYTLTVTEAAPPPKPEALDYGATVQGEIGETDGRDDENRAFDAFRLSGREGHRIQAIMRSGDFDTYLQIGEADGEFSALASDDDGLGEGTDSRLNFILPSTGDYVLRAGPLFTDAEGLYSLELIDRGPQPRAGSILVGATARGTLTEDDAISDDGSFYDAYRIAGKDGETLRVTMISNEFDAYLDIGREDEAGMFTSVASDDDSLSDTQARVDWVVEGDGEYVIRARSFTQGQSGGYVLRVEPKP